MNFSTKSILDIPIADVTPSTIVPLIASLIESPGKKFFFGANPYGFNLTLTNNKFKKTMQKASLVYPEGKGTILASWILGQPLRQRTNFLDFAFDVFTLAQKKKWSIYLLGGTEEVGISAMQTLKKKFPDLKIAGFHNGYFDQKTEKDILNDINKKKPTILYVAMSPPLQELWIARNAGKLNVKAFFTIGGAIDIIAGDIPRAPQWMRNFGLEWLFRIVQEPRRLWKKYLIGNIIFLSMLLSAIMRQKKR